MDGIWGVGRENFFGGKLVKNFVLDIMKYLGPFRYRQ
jgi:hypothetical protein